MFLIKRFVNAGCFLWSFFNSFAAGGSMKIVKLFKFTLHRLPLDVSAFFETHARFSDFSAKARSGFITCFCKKFFVFFDRYKNHRFINSYGMGSQCICLHFIPPIDSSIAYRKMGVKVGKGRK